MAYHSACEVDDVFVIWKILSGRVPGGGKKKK